MEAREGIGYVIVVGPSLGHGWLKLLNHDYDIAFTSQPD